MFVYGLLIGMVLLIFLTLVGGAIYNAGVRKGKQDYQGKNSATEKPSQENQT